MDNNLIVIVFKLPPPYIGTTVWAETLKDSKLKQLTNVVFFNSNIHKDLSTMGKISVKGILKNIALYFELLVFLIKKKPALVVIPISQSGPGFLKDSLFILIARFFSNKILLILHGSNFKNWFDSAFFLMKHYVSWIFKLTCGIIVLGHKIKPLFHKWYKEEHIYVVPNGLNINTPAKTEPAEATRILYLGNLQPSKGIEDLLMAVENVTVSANNVGLHIIGKWGDEKTKQNAHDLASKSAVNVVFHSPKYGEDKFRELFASDIFVFPPRMPEGHPLVIVEAMAAGLPIISTDQGAITESVLDGVNGFIVPSHSPKKIAEKINYLLKNPDERKKMGIESRRLYDQNFTEDKMVENLAEVFKKVMDG